MQKLKQIALARNILVLAAVVGLILSSWTLGHILRYSIPALWHPVVPDPNQKIEIGTELDFAGIRRLAVFPGLKLIQASVQAQAPEMEVSPPVECFALNYYTSLPARCLTTDGNFVTVGGIRTNVIVLPPDE